MAKENTMKSTVKAFNVLETLCLHRAAKASFLSEKLDINKSSVHRLLNVLMELGYVQKSQEPGVYSPTIKVYQLGVAVKNQIGLLGIVRPHMVKLSFATGEIVNLATFLNGWMAVVERIQNVANQRAQIIVDGQLPAYCSAFGKVYLASFSEEQFDDYCKHTEFIRYTDFTLTNPDELQAQFREIRKRWVALDDREFDSGVRCAASPLFDESGQIAATISISGMTARIDDGTYLKYQSMIRETALAASYELGWDGKSFPRS